MRNFQKYQTLIFIAAIGSVSFMAHAVPAENENKEIDSLNPPSRSVLKEIPAEPNRIKELKDIPDSLYFKVMKEVQESQKSDVKDLKQVPNTWKQIAQMNNTFAQSKSFQKGKYAYIASNSNLIAFVSNSKIYLADVKKKEAVSADIDVAILVGLNTRPVKISLDGDTDLYVWRTSGGKLNVSGQQSAKSKKFATEYSLPAYIIENARDRKSVRLNETMFQYFFNSMLVSTKAIAE